MRNTKSKQRRTIGFIVSSIVVAISGHANASGTVELNPATLLRIGTVDERYQSYNIEMIQVMGGEWWAPYDPAAAAPQAGEKPQGFASAPMRYRPPTDLANPRLRKLAKALSPAYVRVSDAWANSVYFQDDDEAAAPPPPGFRSVITRAQWKSVIDYSKELDAKLVTSFAISAGTRDVAGVWSPAEAKKLLGYFERAGGNIAAAEFFNEPNLGVVSGTPKNYDAQAYARDFKIFRDYMKQALPKTKILGPGAVGEDRPLPGLPLGIATEDILKATGPTLDGVSYHFYGAVSQRCAKFGPTFQTSVDAALTPAWLSSTNKLAEFYGNLRDRYEPGKELWLSETAEAACGGNPWAASFLDTFRYLNQLGSLATKDVRVVMHNTLAGSDYALIDDVTLLPRPNYWGAVLWKKLMGSTVLKTAFSAHDNQYLYAHCMAGHPGGVSVLAINADKSNGLELNLNTPGQVFALTASDLLGKRVDLNGRELKLGHQDALPELRGADVRGHVTIPAKSISFVALPSANNASCY